MAEQTTNKSASACNEEELSLIARVFFRRGSQRITDTFVEAKSFGVTGEWFSDPICRSIWCGAENLFSTTADFQSISITQVRKAANVYALRMAEKDPDYYGVTVPADLFSNSQVGMISSADDIKGYANTLRSSYLARKMREEMEKFNDSVANGGDVTTQISSLQGRMSDILTETSPASKVDVRKLLDDINAENEDVYQHVQVNGEVGYTTGWKMPWMRLTRAMRGFHPGLHIIAARPSVGKTSYALQLVRFWLDQGIKVCFNTLDMHPKELLKRQIAELSRVSGEKTGFGFATRADLDRVKTATDRLNKLVDDGIYTIYNEFDMDKLKAQVQILKDQGKIDVLVVDYIQKLTFTGCERLGEYATVTRASKVLHSIMLNMQIPVVALAQLNRGSTKDGGREPEMSDLRSSGQIEQDAFTITILHRDDAIKTAWESNPPTQFFPSGFNVGEDAVKSLDAVWVKLEKAQNGQAGAKIPFVVFKNKFAWYLADYSNKDGKEAIFAKVHGDWRQSFEENTWKQNDCYIDPSIETFNMRNELRGGLGTAQDSSLHQSSNYAPFLGNDEEGAPAGYDEMEDML